MISLSVDTFAERDEEVEETPRQDDDVVDVQPGRVDDGSVAHACLCD